MKTNYLTSVIQMELMQLMGGLAQGDLRGIPRADPGPDLKRAFASGVFDFVVEGVPAKRWYKSYAHSGRCLAQRPLSCELGFDFRIPAGHVGMYAMVEICVREYCRLAVAFFNEHAECVYRSHLKFQHTFRKESVNQLMIENGERIRAE